MRVRGVRWRDEDEAHDARVQAAVDDEAAALRAASGWSPELLRIQEAHRKGRAAGVYGVRAGANEYPIGTPEAEAWERGRAAVEALQRAEDLKRARAKCEPCTCGGRGLCVDAA